MYSKDGKQLWRIRQVWELKSYSSIMVGNMKTLSSRSSVMKMKLNWRRLCHRHLNRMV